MPEPRIIESDFKFDKIDRQADWKAVFDLLDNNFSKVATYLATLGSRVKIESFSAQANQTVFELQDPYNTTKNCLAVYRNGSRQWLSEGFTETSETSFTLTEPCEEGDEIVAVYNRYYLLGDSSSIDYDQVNQAFLDYVKTTNLPQLGEYLDAHPELTTTVVDGSITSDKLNLDLRLKTASFYSSLSSMKTDQSLLVGSIAITLGYYQANDGGGAKYLITNENLIPNDCTIYLLDNGYYAKLIFENEINFRQLGAKSLDSLNTKVDNSPYLDKFMRYINPLGISLYIPSGIWLFSPYVFLKPVIIRGEVMLSRSNNGGSHGTIIAPLQDQQEFIWQFSDSGGAGILANFSIENLVFSTCEYEIVSNNYKIKQYYSTINACVVMRGAELGTCNNLNFHYIKGCALSVESCNEINFGNMSFRFISDPSQPNLKLVGNGSTRSVNSSLFFGDLQFEACVGSLIYVSDYLTNNIFNNIMLEPNLSPDSDGSEIYADSDDYDIQAQSMCILELATSCYIFGTIISSISCDGFSAYSSIIENSQYIYDTVIGGGTTRDVNLQIKNINLCFIRKEFYLFQGSTLGGSSALIDFGTLSYNGVGGVYRALMKGNYAGKFSVKDLSKNYYCGNILYPEDFVFVTYSTDAVSTNLVLPGNPVLPAYTPSLSPYGTAIRSFNEGNSGSKDISKMQIWNHKSIESLWLHVCLVKNAKTTIYLKGKVNGESIVESIDITENSLPSGTWQWKEIFSENHFDEGLLELGFSVASQNTSYIDAMTFNKVT